MANMQTVGFGFGKQSVQGTVATAFTQGRMMLSSSVPRWTEDQARDEHIGLNERPTAQKSAPERIGYAVPIKANWRLYPYLIGNALLLAGFKVSTAANTPETGVHTHTFTLADRDELLWGSAYHAVGEGTLGSARYARTIKDVRLSRLAINSSIQNGIAVESEGLGIVDAAASGSETITNEPNAALNPATGSLTVTSDDITQATFGTPQVHNLTITNPLSEDEGQLHTHLLQDLPLMGLGIGGQMQGLPWAIAQWKELLYAGGAAPGATTLMLPQAQIAWSYESSADISGKSTPYSLEIDIAVATVRLETFDIAGQGKVKVSATYEMIDGASGAPITITLINDNASY